MTHKYHLNHIFSNSWGPGSNQSLIYKIDRVAHAAYKKGVASGRGGKGNIYVFSSGNKGVQGNNCAFKGQSNIIETITIGGVDENAKHLDYSEGCSALMATTFSSRGDNRNIVRSTRQH